MIKIIHSADWHVGPRKGPEKDGVNLRAKDTYNCLGKLVETVVQQKPDFVLIPGDIFDVAAVGQSRSHKEVLRVRKAIQIMAQHARHVVVMRGTPNHDSAEAFEELQAHFEDTPNVDVVTEPRLIEYGEGVDIAVVPGFDAGVFRAKHPGLSKEEENQAFTDELSNIILGLKAQCNPDFTTILMAHNTVPGCNTEAGQNTFLQNFEPVITSETLHAAGYDLMCLGHIHRPQELPTVPHCFYSGALNALNFNDEGQDRGFWIHSIGDDKQITSDFVKTPYRHFRTIHLSEDDIRQINAGAVELVGASKWNGQITDKIVRALYHCDEDANKAFNHAEFERQLMADGAFYVWDISPERIEASVSRKDMDRMSPEDNLREYLQTKGYETDRIDQLVKKARPIISQAVVNSNSSALVGSFVPISIEVKNYRNYEQESFDFRNIKFCTINGQNGAGKSSLFMDAILDCLWEEPREGDLTGWIRNDETARSGAITFTFSIGDKTFRVTRTRARSGKATLNLSENVEGEWINRSKDRFKDTQEEITKLIGMDSLTFKSCALIMQDQYGIFLEAPKDERMQILGNLLGLGIYGDMEKIAWDTARQYGAKMRSAQAEVKIHESTIDGYGNPEQALEALQPQIEEQKKALEEATDKKNLLEVKWTALRSAQNEREEVQAGINLLNEKKTATEDAVKVQKDIIDSAELMLSSEDAINQKVQECKDLDAKKQSLSEKAAIYQAKADQLAEKTRRVYDLKDQIGAKQAQIDSTKVSIGTLKNTDDIAFISAKAAEYKTKKSQLDEISQKRSEYLEALGRVRDAKNQLDKETYTWDSKILKLTSQKTSYEKQAQLLADSNCIDPENAHCRFLQSAIEAKEKIAAVDDALIETEAGKASAVAKKTEMFNTANTALSEFSDYDESEYLGLKEEVAGLSVYEQKAKQLEAQKQKLTELGAKLKADEQMLEELQTQANKALLEQNVAAEEVKTYKSASDELKAVNDSLVRLQRYVDMQSKLPLYKERKATAEERIKDMHDRISDIDASLAEKKLKLADIITSLADFEETKQALAEAGNLVYQINSQLSSLQRQAGGYEQKVAEIKKLEDGIKGLRDQINEYSVETADYDTLKAAFSQDGIPHQIVRSILPKLASTANTILSQMTGGKMSLDFRTEKTLKSNSKKEVTTLDILISESGKSTLPYLSKSGGEKVKASLSVILALSEVKSEAAGVQIGMLFIDEPPFLDSDGIEAYCDSLQTIQSRYPDIKIMAITHDPRMKARFPQSITVTKDEHGSHVQWD